MHFGVLVDRAIDRDEEPGPLEGFQVLVSASRRFGSAVELILDFFPMGGRLQ